MDGGTCRWVLMVIFKQGRGSNCRRAAQLTFPEISLAAYANLNSSDMAAYHSKTGPNRALTSGTHLPVLVIGGAKRHRLRHAWVRQQRAVHLRKWE